MVNAIFYSTMLMCWQAQARCQRSRTASETLGQSVKSTHWRLEHANSEAAAASVRRPQPRKNTDWRLLQAASEAAVDDFVRDGRFFYTLR